MIYFKILVLFIRCFFAFILLSRLRVKYKVRVKDRVVNMLKKSKLIFLYRKTAAL